jgi:VanZ family protein
MKLIRAYLSNKYFNYLTFSLWTAVILYLSLGKFTNKIDKEIMIPYADKIVHMLMYFVYSMILFLNYSENKNKNKSLFIIIYCAGFSLIMELLQHYIFTYRSGDVKDFLANLIGIILSGMVYNKIKNTINSILP